jgi:glycosyltransferase involved in cell wall biosynthesis
MSSTLYYWLSDNPMVLRYVETSDGDIGHWLSDTKLYRLPVYYWHTTAEAIEQYHLRAKTLRPRHCLHHLVNDRDVCNQLVARGIPATFCSTNAFVDERIFNLDPRAGKRFDAVYNARMSPFKRHSLAREIKSLLVIGGVLAPGDSGAYFQEVRNSLTHAEFTHANEHSRWFSANEVAAQIRPARVGLCLSATEGAMYAAAEYLLCGLPVVSTVSLGGRDEWFDARFVRIVPDDPKAVADAVAELIRLKLDERWIRQETLRRACEHRRRLVEVVQGIFDAEMAGRDFARELYPRLFNKLGDWRPLDQLMDLVHRDCDR